MFAIAVISLLGLSAITWMISEPWRVMRRRKHITRQAFPKTWRAILKRRLPFFKSLPTDLQLQLKKHIQVFINEKQFIGCDGFAITEEVKVTIAAQACLLLLNRHTNYFPKLKQILVYPSAFIVNNQHTNTDGVVSEKRNVLSGESWQTGKVVLSWANTLDGAAIPNDGNNVVIHEFAHQLDQEDGKANGAPILQNITDYKAWSSTLGDEFSKLQYCAAHQLPSTFSYYGATDPAEFFAVATEVFFERPFDVYQQHKALYQELSHFYQLDPINWQ